MGPFVLEFSKETILISLLIFAVRVVGMALDYLTYHACYDSEEQG